MDTAARIMDLVASIDKLDSAVSAVHKSLEEQTTEQKIVSLKDDMEIIGISREVDEIIGELNRFFGYNKQYESRFVAVRDNYIKKYSKPAEEETQTEDVVNQQEKNNPIQLSQEQLVPKQETVIHQSPPQMPPAQQYNTTTAEVIKPKA